VYVNSSVGVGVELARGLVMGCEGGVDRGGGGGGGGEGGMTGGDLGGRTLLPGDVEGQPLPIARCIEA